MHLHYSLDKPGFTSPLTKISSFHSQETQSRMKYIYQNLPFPSLVILLLYYTPYTIKIRSSLLFCLSTHLCYAPSHKTHCRQNSCSWIYKCRYTIQVNPIHSMPFYQYILSTYCGLFIFAFFTYLLILFFLSYYFLPIYSHYGCKQILDNIFYTSGIFQGLI